MLPRHHSRCRERSRLDEVDKELERRGIASFVTPAAANVYVRSRRADERVMRLLRRFYARLRLRVNEAKSTIASVFRRKFLGRSFWVAAGGKIKRRWPIRP
jgi:retron-type reverse transcriptase